jgi:hypothetical protein
MAYCNMWTVSGTCGDGTGDGEGDLVKGDFRGCCRRVDTLVESAVGVMSLLLDSGAELQEVFRDVLIRSSKDID